MKVAVVYNHGKRDVVINRFGLRCPEKYSLRHVQSVAGALRQMGHEVAVFQADISLFGELHRFLAGGPSAMVFNMAYGIQGDARYTHLPAMLELAGVPYTGSDPLGHALALDKVITKILLVDAGVPTPPYRVQEWHADTAAGRQTNPPSPPAELHFPLVVKPRHESTSYGLRLVHSQKELDEGVAAIGREYGQEALVEQYIDGREVCIGLLGNDPVELLPPVELDFGGRARRLMTWDDKYHKRADEPRKVCPAPLADRLLNRLNQLALATYRACRVRDHARVDIRIDPQGNPFVLEINSMPSLGDGGSFVLAARSAGYSFETLVQSILHAAHRRYVGVQTADDAGNNPVVADPSVIAPLV
jgi:D-alanine-D-alanine ligase